MAGKRHRLDRAAISLAFGEDEDGKPRAELDVYAEGGKKGGVGVHLESLVLPGAKVFADLGGKVIIDPAPALLGLARLPSAGGGLPPGLTTAGASAAQAPDGAATGGAATDGAAEEPEAQRLSAEEIASRAAAADLDPDDLDDDAIDELWDDFERVVLLPGREVELEQLRLELGAPVKGFIVAKLFGEGTLHVGEVGDDDDDEEEGEERVSVRAELHCRLETADD